MGYTGDSFRKVYDENGNLIDPEDIMLDKTRELIGFRSNLTTKMKSEKDFEYHPFVFQIDNNYSWINKGEEGRYIDLFCGAGGLSLGIEQNGYEHALSIDFDKDSIETYKFNRYLGKSKSILCDDIINLTKNKWKEWQHLAGKVEIIAGGPPCQGFSTANRRRLIDDPRNELYKNFIQTVNIFKPKVVIMENVQGILKREDDIRNDFNKIGYYGKATKLKAQDFGIPQNRVRVFFIMLGPMFDDFKQINMIDNIHSIIEELKESADHYVLKDALKYLPKLISNPYKNMTDYEGHESGYFAVKNKSKSTNNYIDSVNRKSNYSSDFIFNHKSTYNNERDIKIYDRLPQGGDSTHESIKDIMPYTNRAHIFKDKLYKLKNNSISKAITAHMKVDTHMYIHPTQARGLTPREAARVQSFPDDYIFKGSFKNWYKQIGNAVPPKLAYNIVKAVKEVLNK